MPPEIELTNLGGPFPPYFSFYFLYFSVRIMDRMAVAPQANMDCDVY